MSVLQLEELVSYQLRTGYLDEIADGVGERLLNINESFLNSAPFKAAGWRPNPALTKRTYSPPIPTAVASEYFQAPPRVGLSLEDGEEDGGMLTGGGVDTMGPGMAIKRRRRREQMEEEDSSDLSDESDEEPEQRAAQQIKFSKMPVRHRAGSSPNRTSPLKAQASPRVPRRGSQSALETVRERPRRGTITSSDVSSENDYDVRPGHLPPGLLSTQAKTARPSQELVRGTALLEDDEEEEEEEEEEEDDSDEGSDVSGDLAASIDLPSILEGVENPMNRSPTQPLVGTPPRNFVRQLSLVRKPQVVAAELTTLEALPPPRPMSTIRPLSQAPPQSLLSEALQAKEHKASVPFQRFAHFDGKGTQGAIAARIYVPSSAAPQQSYEVFIRSRVQDDGQGAERVVTVADLIGLSLYRYNEAKREPVIAAGKQDINWWVLRMAEEGGEVDDDFPPFERTKPLASFTSVSSSGAGARGAGRLRANSAAAAFDDFALVAATVEEYEENKLLTPQPKAAGAAEGEKAKATQRQWQRQSQQGERREGGGEQQKQQKQQQQQQQQQPASSSRTGPRTSGGREDGGGVRPWQNPIVTTTYRPKMALADAPQTPTTAANTARGQQKTLRIHIMTGGDVSPGQTVTVQVTTDTYLAEVQDQVCRRRQLDKANHVLKLPGSGAVVMIDRPVSSIGNVSDLELCRRRFATDGPLSMTGSPSSLSPKMMPLADSQGMAQRRSHKNKGQAAGPHPLARETWESEGPGAGGSGTSSYRRYTVWRKQPMRIVGMSERVLVIDGEYIHIVPASGGKAIYEGGGKTTTVHFSNVIGCKVARKHPTNVKLVIYKATESKRYDFEARSADEAAEIVAELKKGISPNREL